MSKDDPLANIMSELEGGSRIAVPKRRVVSLPKPLVAPRGVVGSGLGTGSMNPRGDMSRRLLVDDGGVGLGQIETARAQGPYMDEVDAYLEQKAKAAVGPNGERLDDFYMRANQNRLAHATIEEQAKFSRLNPPSATKHLLGNTATVGAGERQSVALFDGEDVETTPVSVAFGPPQPAEAPTAVINATNTPRAVGYVRFGTRGVGVEVAVDIGLGVQFTVPASYALVDVAAEGGAAATQKLILSGMLSFMPVVRTTPLTRTLFYVLVEGGITGFIRIPTFARNIVVWRSNIASSFVLTLYDLNSNALLTYTQAANTLMTNAIPLPSWANQFNVEASVGGAAATYSVMFELAL